jgi:alanine dehydrogenase
MREYEYHGRKVLVETDDGSGIGTSDRVYRNVGADFAGSAVFAHTGKVKEQSPREWKLLRQGHILLAYLYLASDREQSIGLLQSCRTAIAYGI